MDVEYNEVETRNDYKKVQEIGEITTEITIEEVKRSLKKSEAGKGKGIDNIDPAMLKYMGKKEKKDYWRFTCNLGKWKIYQNNWKRM